MRRAPWLILASVLGFFAAVKLHVAAAATEWEYDEGVYLCSARALLRGYELFTEIFSSQPPAFLESLALMMRVAGDTLVAAHVYILFFGLVTLAVCGELARRIAGPWAAAGAVTALACVHTMLELSGLVQAELPALALASCSLLLCLHARGRGWQRRWLLASGALYGLSALFKLYVVPIAVPLVLLLLLAPQAATNAESWSLDGRGWPLLRRTLQRACVLAAGAAIVAVVPLLVYEHEPFFDQAVAFHLAKLDEFRLNPSFNWSLVQGELRRSIGVSLIGAAGLVLLLRRRPTPALWLLAWLAASLLVILRQSPLFWRHLSLLLPPLCIAAGMAVAAAAQSRLRVIRIIAPAALLLLLGVTLDASLRPGWEPGRRARELVEAPKSRPGLERMSQWLAENTREDELVVSDDPISVYLAGRMAPPALCDTSVARIRSGYLRLSQLTGQDAATPVIMLRREGRLSMVIGYARWLKENYDQLDWDAEFGAERHVWLREDL